MQKKQLRLNYATNPQAKQVTVTQHIKKQPAKENSQEISQHKLE